MLNGKPFKRKTEHQRKVERLQKRQKREFAKRIAQERMRQYLQLESEIRSGEARPVRKGDSMHSHLMPVRKVHNNRPKRKKQL